MSLLGWDVRERACVYGCMCERVKERERKERKKERKKKLTHRS
jgi:hypothetical protein